MPEPMSSTPLLVGSAKPVVEKPIVAAKNAARKRGNLMEAVVRNTILVASLIAIVAMGVYLYRLYSPVKDGSGGLDGLAKTVDALKTTVDEIKREVTELKKTSQPAEKPAVAAKATPKAGDAGSEVTAQATLKVSPDPVFQITIDQDGVLNGVIRINDRKIDPGSFDGQALALALSQIAAEVNGDVPVGKQAEVKANQGAKVEGIKAPPEEDPKEPAKTPRVSPKAPEKSPIGSQPAAKKQLAGGAVRQKVRRQVIIDSVPYVPLRLLGQPWRAGDPF